MSKVRTELEVPIPAGTRQFKDTNPSAAGATNIVLVSHDCGRRQVIRLGRKAERDGFMHPNDEYFRLFGGTYNEYVQNNPVDRRLYLPAPSSTLSVGLYTVVLAAAERLGLYDMLVQTHGVKVANAAMDYVSFLIRTRCNSVERMTCELNNQVMFCNPIYSDSWFSDLFSSKEQLDCNNVFMDNWIKHWIEKGISEVYISIDGSNIDCESENNLDAERGKDKSGQHTTILSFMWVVVASGRYKGMPLAYVSYQGSQVDCAGIKVLLARLSGYGLRVVCAVLDRGFCTTPAMDQLHELELPFVIMMTDKTGGHQTMVQEHGDEIRLASEHYIGNKRFGTVDYTKVFKRGDAKAFVALVYDPFAAAAQITNLLDEIYDAVQQTKRTAQKTGKQPVVPEKYKDYIRVDDNENEGTNRYTISILYDAVNAEIKRKGFITLASSEKKSAKEVSEIYDMRAPSELAFMFLKTPLGGYVIRTHTYISSKGKMFYSLLAVAIYNEIQFMCSEAEVKASSTIPKLDRVQYLLANGRYVFSENFSPAPRKLLQSLGITGENFRIFASEVNRRYIPTKGNLEDTESCHNGRREHVIHSIDALAGSKVHTCMESDMKGTGVEIPSPWDFEVKLEDLEKLKNHDTVTGFDEVCEVEDKADPIKVLLNKMSVSKEGKAASERDLALGELHLTDSKDSFEEKTRKRGRPLGSKDKTPRHRRTFAELGKETKSASTLTADVTDTPASSRRTGRKPGSKDSYKRTRRTKAELEAARNPSQSS